LSTTRPPSADSAEGIRQDLIAVGLEGDVEAAHALAAYLQLIVRWNRTYNLTGPKDAARLRTEHLADCMAVVPALRRLRAASSPIHVLDVGSGAGLPGVVLAILHPSWQVTCIDAVGKKAAFIRQAAGQLNLSNLESVHARVESIEPSPRDSYDIIISRAFSNLHQLVDLTRPLLRSGGVWVAMKGKIPKEELADIPEDVVVRNVQQVEVPGSVARRCLVILSVKYPSLHRE
jgi:16S rRNA (guanine527-N7)-methyltransferase